jgi:hypothetical protein
MRWKRSRDPPALLIFLPPLPSPFLAHRLLSRSHFLLPLLPGHILHVWGLVLLELPQRNLPRSARPCVV